MMEYDEHIRGKKESYSESSAKYLDAVDRWQAKPNNVVLASKMGLFGRLMQRKRKDLEMSITIAIAENIERLVNAVSTLQLTLDYLAQYESQLNRHLGYLEHPTPLRPERKREMARTYEKERGELLAKLQKLRETLPDDREVEFRRLRNAGALSH